MSATPAQIDPIEIYLMHLNAALLDVPRGERDEFLREIRTHIFEKLQTEGTRPQDVLERLGDAEELARQYRAECSLTKSARSWAPWTLLRAAVRWGLTGFQGFAMFVVAVIGYSMAIAFYVTAVLKPIYPHNIGFFVSSNGLNLASWPAPRGQEVLAPYYTLIAMIVGFLFVAGTSFVLRLMMRNFASARRRLA
jgi:uncharacterized membrane protein